MTIGLIPIGILGYGLIKKNRTALIVGGLWLAVNLLYTSTKDTAK